MTFIKYFTTSYLRHLLLINLCVTSLFVCIEFFEKMMRTQDVAIATILTFLGLTFIPSFFEYIPLSCWLATLFLIKEMQTHNEWEGLSILGIQQSTIARYLLFIGLGCLSVNFIGKELLTAQLANKVERFKKKHFKHTSSYTLYNSWLMLDDQTLLSVGILDQKNMSAHNILVTKMGEDFSAKLLIHADDASLDASTQFLTLHNASTLTPDTATQHTTSEVQLAAPALFSYLQLAQPQPPIALLTSQLLSGHKLERRLARQIKRSILQTITWHIPVAVLPLLTFLLFCLPFLSINNRWLCMLLVYPTTTLLSTMSTFLVAQGLPLLLLFSPFFLLLGAIFAIRNVIF